MNKSLDNFVIEKFKNSAKLIRRFTIVFLLLLIPTVTYIVIININKALDYYFDNIDIIKENFGRNVIVSYSSIMINSWVSLSLIISALIMIAFLGLILKAKISDFKKISYIVIIGFLAILSIVLIAVSEFSYSRFYYLYDFLINNDEGLKLENDDAIEKLRLGFIEIYGKGITKFKWSNDSLTWWLAILKIIFVILFFSIWLRNNKNNNQILTVSKSINRSGIKELISKFSLNDTKNILFWLIIGTTLVFITPLIYIINMSVFNSKMGSMLNWTFIVTDLYKNIDTLSSETIKSSYFVIKFLPIIVSGFLISNILISIVAYVQNWNRSKYSFAMQYILLLVEIIFVLIVIAYSSHEAQKITNYWNQGTITIPKIALESKYLKEVYGFPFINNEMPDPWLSGLKYISQTIISISFLATIYIILGVKFKKVSNNL
ncbi:hypothetical protein [Spiroplasma diminutum]|uniref:Uncharacterized protein n=1 Tax=Spiroplasma diminutum CUAS-1 TaxID=1276221 RepID=S5M376_9MOLU|nr:hypothetical protein [Spiroplasma diminutum]AGR42512.1 hypothetical protein SDIMI_v3c08080 [Spiroplasma diminutum CUAS-1]